MTSPSSGAPTTSPSTPVTGPVSEEMLQQSQQEVSDLQDQVNKVIADRQSGEQQRALDARMVQLENEKMRLRTQLVHEQYLSTINDPATASANATMQALVAQEQAQRDSMAADAAAKAAAQAASSSSSSSSSPVASSTAPVPSTSTTPTGA